MAVNPIGAVLALVVFFIVVLKLSKYVSLSSVFSIVFSIVCNSVLNMSMTGKIVTAAVILLLIYRHKENLIRIKNGTENKNYLDVNMLVNT